MDLSTISWQDSGIHELGSVLLLGQNLNLQLAGWPRHLLSELVGYLQKISTLKIHLKSGTFP